MILANNCGSVRVLFLSTTVLVLPCLAMPAMAQIYEPGPPPTADIDHVTVESIPGPTSRTTIGIKEQVTCSIANWNDIDYLVDESSATEVGDSYGTVTWSCGSGTVNPTTGPTTTYTAPESATDTSDTVTMTADDSPLGDDTAIPVGLAFAIKIPTGHAATKDSDSPLADAGPPDVNIGSRTYWWPQVLPTTVSFKNVSFRENIPLQTSVWPNGDTETWPAQQYPWSVAPRNGAPNVWTVTDVRSSGKYPKGKLWNGTAHVNHLDVWSIPWEFKANGNWIYFTDPPMKEQYTGATLKTKITFDTTWGSEQGPYKN